MSEPVALKYRAFLSYAHADTSWATWRHGRLAGFPIDADLVGRMTAIGPVPRSLRPIFRDREDFSGGRTRVDATIAELDQSAALIVVGSTVSVERPAVQKEVRLFRSRHPDRPVIPVIVDGAYPTNFPPGLRFELGGDGAVTDRPVTILGPALRETGDGRSRGLAKVIAGLTGLDTDRIFRRAERARRRRRRLLATAVVAVCVVVASLAGWAAMQRRRFANYWELATKFNAVQVTDVTEGWDDPGKLAQETLAAVRQIVSDKWGFRGVKIPHSTELRGGGRARSAKAARGEDLQIEHPVWCGDSPTFHCHATPASVLGPALIGTRLYRCTSPVRNACGLPLG